MLKLNWIVHRNNLNNNTSFANQPATNSSQIEPQPPWKDHKRQSNSQFRFARSAFALAATSPNSTATYTRNNQLSQRWLIDRSLATDQCSACPQPPDNSRALTKYSSALEYRIEHASTNQLAFSKHLLALNGTRLVIKTNTKLTEALLFMFGQSHSPIQQHERMISAMATKAPALSEGEPSIAG